MAKKKKEKKEEKEEVPFDYIEYINESIERPKAFIYYLTVNDIIIKDEKELEKVYKKYNELGGN